MTNEQRDTWVIAETLITAVRSVSSAYECDFCGGEEELVNTKQKRLLINHLSNSLGIEQIENTIVLLNNTLKKMGYEPFFDKQKKGEGSKFQKGQVWEQKRTPRRGEDKYWTIEKLLSSNRCELECVGTKERKIIKEDSIERDYKIHYDPNFEERGDKK